MTAFHYFQPSWNQDFHRLYGKASREQWAVGDLPWEALGELDAEWRRGMLACLSPLLVSERGAMNACGVMIPRVRERGDHDAELVMHAMMLDEARHWEGLNRIFCEFGAEPTPIGECREMLGINLLIMRSGDFDQWLWCIQICDIIAGHLYAAFKGSTDSPPVRELFTGFLRDEARHHRFCTLFFERGAAAFSPEQRARYRRHGDKLLRKFEHLMCHMLGDDLRRIGCDPRGIFEKIAASVERQAQHYGFVVPPTS